MKNKTAVVSTKERTRREAILINALNDIASWNQGSKVDVTFDEPVSALEARKALAAYKKGV